MSPQISSVVGTQMLDDFFKEESFESVSEIWNNICFLKIVRIITQKVKFRTEKKEPWKEKVLRTPVFSFLDVTSHVAPFQFHNSSPSIPPLHLTCKMVLFSPFLVCSVYPLWGCSLTLSIILQSCLFTATVWRATLQLWLNPSSLSSYLGSFLSSAR